MLSYIVRIYRWEKRPHRVVGVVEEAGVEGKRAFTTLEELWNILVRSRKLCQDLPLNVPGSGKEM